MSFKDRISYLKSRFVQVSNILLIVIIAVILIIIMSCLTVMNFVRTFKQDMINTNSDMRSLLVYAENENEDDYLKINNIDHVVLNVSTKYHHSHYVDVKEFDNENIEGYLTILPQLNTDDLKIVKGKKNINQGEAICPSNFYPHNLYINEESTTMQIIPSAYIKEKDILGKAFKIKSKNSENEDIMVSIVGIYDNKTSMKSINTCLISMEDFEQVVSPYEYIEEWTNLEGETFYNKVEYKGRFIQVDKYSNLEYVKKELLSSGLKAYNVINLDYELLKNMLLVPMFIGLIVIIVSLNVIYSFIKKKSKYRINQYGILKSYGYKNSDVILTDILENIIIFIISFMLSFIIYIILFIFIKNVFLVELIYENYNIYIPLLYIIVFIILFIIFVIITNKRIINNILKGSVNSLLRNN